MKFSSHYHAGFGPGLRWELGLDEIDEIVEPPPSEEAMLSVAEGQRLDLQAAGWALAGAERRIELMRREGWPDVVFAFHDGDEIGPKMLTKIAKTTGLKAEEL